MNHSITVFDGVRLRIDKPLPIHSHPGCLFTKVCISADDGSYSEITIHHNQPLTIEHEEETTND